MAYRRDRLHLCLHCASVSQIGNMRRTRLDALYQARAETQLPAAAGILCSKCACRWNWGALRDWPDPAAVRSEAREGVAS